MANTKPYGVYEYSSDDLNCDSSDFEQDFPDMEFEGKGKSPASKRQRTYEATPVSPSTDTPTVVSTIAPTVAPTPETEELWEKTDQPLRDLLLCPITGGLFEDPVIASDGRTYTRKAIHKWFITWFENNENSDSLPTSPHTNLPLESLELYENRLARDLLNMLKR